MCQNKTLYCIQQYLPDNNFAMTSQVHEQCWFQHPNQNQFDL